MAEKTNFILATGEGESPVLEVVSAKVTDFRRLPRAAETEQQGYNLLSASALRLLNSGGQSLAIKGTYRLVVDPKVGHTILAGVKDAPGLYRGFSRSGGKITQHAKFKPVQGAKLATLAVAVFEVATIVTSTVHLKEIGQQLKQVNSRLDQIQDLLDDQRLGRLHGNLAYLSEILAMLDSGNLPPSTTARYDAQLEGIYLDCLAEMRTSAQQLVRRQRELRDVAKVKLGGFWIWKKASKEGQQDVEKQVLNFSASLEIALLAQEVAVMSCAVASQLGRSPAESRYRLERLEEQVEHLKINWNDYADILKTKFEDVEERGEVQQTLRKLTLHVQQHHERPKRLLNAVKVLNEQLTYRDSLEFIVQVENGEVVEARRVIQEQA